MLVARRGIQSQRNVLPPAIRSRLFKGFGGLRIGVESVWRRGAVASFNKDQPKSYPACKQLLLNLYRALDRVGLRSEPHAACPHCVPSKTKNKSTNSKQ